MCRYCGEQAPGGFHVRPLFLALVLIIAAAFGAATVSANRFYEAKQQRLGEMWFGRGQTALSAGQPQAAIQDFRNALYYSHDDPSYRLQLAEALVAANRISEAQSYLITLWQDQPSNSTINLQLARLAVRQGGKQNALRYYHGAIYGMWPDGAAAIRRQQTRLELIHYLLGLHDTTQADAELIALTPELPSDAAVHTKVGWLFMQAGDQGRALEEFQHAMHLNPRDSSAAWGAGKAAFQLGQYRPAEYYLDRAVHLQRPLPEAEKLLRTMRLVLSLNPYAPRLSSRQRTQRVVQAFRYARQRLLRCAASQGVELQPVPAVAAQASTPAAPQTTVPSGSPSGKKPAPGLVAKILGRVEGAQVAAPTAPQPPRGANPAAMQQLYQQVIGARNNVRSYKLARDPQLADSVMTLVNQIEMVTSHQCGNPEGADLALLLLAREAEQQ